MKKLIFLTILLANIRIAHADDSSPPTKSIFGGYSYFHKVCDAEGCNRVEDTAVIVPNGGSIVVAVSLIFDFGHICEITAAVAEWEDGRLKVSGDEDDFVYISFKDDKAYFQHESQSGGPSSFCGARGGFSKDRPLAKAWSISKIANKSSKPTR